MNLQQIKEAIAAGKKVYWSNTSYEVIKDKIGQYLIKCTNGSAIGLTWQDGVTMNGKEEDFFMDEPIKVGSKVKFAKELQPGENKFEMTVIEVNGDRCLIETEMDLFVNPRSTVMVKDLIPAGEVEQLTFTRKTYTFQEINEMYNYKKWYVGTFEIESFKKGTTSHYAFAYRKTGDKDKFGGDIYFETGRVYFELIAPFTYQECENPYKK